MRFLADMGVSQQVVEWLRSSGHEAVHLRNEGRVAQHYPILI
jgi:predicted nuclease of predicted toxin-antitoxin system